LNFSDIVAFARWLWRDALSPAQACLLKAAYGLPLDRAERAVWRRYTGRSAFGRYHQHRPDTVVAILGRQSGKSSRIGATIALYEALVVPHDIPAGERLAVLMFAPVIRQSTFALTAEKLRGAPELAQMVETDVSSAGEIRLVNGIDLVTFSSNPAHARGRTAILAIVDEAAFLHSDREFDCNLPELLESVRPSLLVRHGRLVLLSSPGDKSGPIYEAWQNRAEDPDTLVWRAPSAEMNPGIDAKLLERERKRGASYFAREWEAEFVDARNPFLPPESIDAAILPRTVQLAPAQSDSAVFAGIDLADKRDDCALAISAIRTVEGRRKVVVLFVKAWKPGPRGHVVPDVLEQMGEICRAYRVGLARGDQKSMSTAEHILGRFGIRFERVITDGRGSEPMYRCFLGLLNNSDIALLDHPELLAQLRRLEEHTGDGGRFRVAGRRNSKDDLAVSAVLAVSMAADALAQPELNITVLDLDHPGAQVGYVKHDGTIVGDGPERWWHSI
jgi:hypothetical protein